MAFETLDIKIKAEAGDAESALDEVKDSLIESDAAVEQFSSSLNEAEEETEELEDETGSLNRSLTTLIGVSNRGKEGIQNFGNAAGGAAVSVATLGGSITALEAALAPLVAGGAVALGAVAGGLAAVAGAAGLVVGSGLLAFGQELAGNNQRRLNQLNKRIETLQALEQTESGLTAKQSEQLKTLKNRRKEIEETTTAAGALTERLSEIRSAFVDAFSEAGEQFVPLVRDGLNALPPLIRRLGRAFGNADLSNVTALLRDLGRFIQQTAVPALRSFLRFANDVAGAIRRIGRTEQARTVIDGIQQAFGAIARSLPTVVDELGQFINDAIAFGQSDQFREILNEIRTQFEEIRPELAELSENLPKFLNTLAEEGPDIIRGIGAAIDVTADAINALEPLINLTIRVLGRLGRDLASFRRDSEEAARSIKNLISTTKTVINNVGSFLGNRAPNIIRTAVSGLFSSLITAAKDLKRDLIGNSILKDIFTEFAAFLRNTATTIIGNAIDQVVSSIETPFSNIDFGGVVSELNNILSVARSAIDAAEEAAGLDPGGRTTRPDTREPPQSDDPGDGGSGGGGASNSPGRGTGIGGVGDPRPGVGIATGGLIASGGVARLHEGERVVPAAQVEDRGPAPSGISIQNLTVNASSRAEGRQAANALKDELKRFDI